ncbi:hypothetical protein LCGC14_1198030 [marine sediment metagenome]|uniref:Uncharacterized protein n=1 Tax=marine sediment metagenome TaxID=412755 RepID=A0A0F9PMK6_9ZZZZ
MENPYPKIDHPDSELPCHICEGHREAWDEGKAEQAEIVSELVAACQVAELVLSVGTTQGEVEAAIRLQDAIHEATQ